MTKSPGVKRVYWDIETAPNLVWSWRIGYNLNLGHDNIVKERKIICICWNYEGEDKVYSLTWDKNQDDKAMLKEFLKVANDADELVAQYGDAFDLPWFKTRCLIHGLEPLPDYKTIDTKAWASKNFYFNSNKLDYIADILGFGKKLETKFSLWLDVIKGSKTALDYMVKYCKVDVIRLKQVYGKLSKCVKPKTHIGVLNGHGRSSCPHCGSDNVVHSKLRVSGSGVKSHQFKCSKCEGYFTIADKIYQDAYHPKDHSKAQASRKTYPKASPVS